MGVENQETTATTTAATKQEVGHGAATVGHQQPATARVQGVLAKGRPSPEEIAILLQEANTTARSEIVALLHASVGNAFVTTVMSLVSFTLPDTAQTEEQLPLGPVRVTARSGLRIRTSCSTQGRANIVGKLRDGVVVTAVGREGAWLKIEHNGQPAFIHADWVESVAKAPAITDASPPTAKSKTPEGSEETDPYRP